MKNQSINQQTKHSFIINKGLMKINKLQALWFAAVFLLIFSGLSLQLTNAQSSKNHSTAPTTPPKPLKGLDAYIHKVMKQWQVPGLAIAVVKDGKVVLAKGYGVRELGKPGKVNANTLFTIGSVTKQFTAAALGTLVSEGKLIWDAPVTQYVKNFKLSSSYVTEHITLRDLLTHRSGYSDPGVVWYTSNASDIIQRLRYQKPRYGFRAHFCYNNVMFLTAARFIPAITGETWNRYVKEHLFSPLGMNRTVTTSKAKSEASNIASPHGMIDGKMSVIRRYWSHNLDFFAPVGDINSSANDMSHWLLMLLNNGRYQDKTILASSVLREMETPQVLIRQQNNSITGYFMRMMSPGSHYYANGLGLHIEDYDRHKMVWHSGHIDGMTTFMALIPATHLGVAVLSNMNDDDYAVPGILFFVLQSYLGLDHHDMSKLIYNDMKGREKKSGIIEKKLRATRKPGTKAPLPISSYAGFYKDRFDGTALVRVENEHLVLRLGNPNFTGDLEHWHDNTFRVTWRYHFYGKNYVTFDFDALGKPVKLSFPQESLHYERVDKSDSTVGN